MSKSKSFYSAVSLALIFCAAIALSSTPVQAQTPPVLKPMKGTCIFMGVRPTMRILKEKIIAQLTALNYTKIRVRIKIGDKQVKLEDLRPTFGVYYSNGDPNLLEIVIDNIYNECEIQLPISVNVKAVDSTGQILEATKDSTVTVKGTLK